MRTLTELFGRAFLSFILFCMASAASATTIFTDISPTYTCCGFSWNVGLVPALRRGGG